jgi:hypothetical protein
MTFVPVCLSGCLRIVSTDLEKVAAAFPAMIRGKKGLQDHIFAILTHIIANFRRSCDLPSVSSSSPNHILSYGPPEKRLERNS